MQKLLLLSVLVATVAIPSWGAGSPSPKQGLKRTVIFILLFNLFYLLCLRVIYPRLAG